MPFPVPYRPCREAAEPSRVGCASRRRSLLAALALALALAASGGARAAIAVCFSPPSPGGCDPTRILVGALDTARRTIRVQIYTLTARPIVAALIRARGRGVDVRAIVDRGALRDDSHDAQAVARLAAAGIPVRVDTVPGLMHDKIAIVDDATVLTGSFNYTWSAEHRNAENLLAIRDPALAAIYAANWRLAEARARPLGARPAPHARVAAAGPAGAVRGNRNSMIYQWPGCPYYNRIAPGNRVAFASAAAAQHAGYRPAHGCR